MNELSEDLRLLEKAGFQHNVTFVAQCMIISLHYLKTLASERGVPLEKISGEDIIKEMAKPDGQIRDNLRQMEAFFSKPK